MTDAPKPIKPKFDTLAQETYLSLWRTYDRLKALEDQLFSSFLITAQQYNVLRLLDAAAIPLPTLAIASKLVSRAPDITRMLDRLEKDQWIARTRSKEDRRTVLVSITAKGKERLAEIALPLDQMHQQQLGHMDPNDLEQLCRILSKVRRPHESPNSYW